MHVQYATYCPGLQGAGGESLGLHPWRLGGARLVPGALLDWQVHHCAPWAGRLKSQSGPAPLSAPQCGFEAVTGDMGIWEPSTAAVWLQAKY